MRWNNQPDYGPWNAVADIAGAIMQRNQQRGQEKKDLQSTQSLFSLLQPSDVDTGTGMRSQLNLDPSLQSIRGSEVPQKGLFDFAKIGQTPPIYNGPQDQQPIGLMQPQQVTGQNALTMPQQPSPQIQAPTITQKERTIKDVERDIRKNYMTRIQDAIKSGTINSDMLRQNMPQLRQQMNTEIEQARGDYSKQQEQAAWTAFDAAPDYRTKMMTGIKAGLNPQLLKMALDTGTEIKMIDTGDKIVPVSIDPRNNKVIDMTTGNPVDSATLTKGITQYQRESLDLTRRGQDITMRGQDISAASRSSGGGSAGASRYVNTPLGAMTTDQLLDTYTKAKGGRIKTVDANGVESYKEVPPNQEILDILGPIIQQASGGGTYQPQQSEDPRVAQARALGYSDAEIQAFLNGSRQQPQPQRAVRQPPTLTDNGNLDVINNNWQF